jgi:PKD repeat protein
MQKIILALTASVAVLAWGCTPSPVACFTKDGTIVDIYQNVNFTNCSSDYESVSWSFGDGTSSNDLNPAKSWTTPADYLVALEVQDENQTRTDNTSEIVRVGKRYLTVLTIAEIPADNGGTPWDASDSPDLKVRMGKVSDHIDLYASAENTDLLATVPYDINATALAIELTPEPWYILLEDVDGATSDTVGYWELNLNAGFPGLRLLPASTNVRVNISYRVQ